MSGQPTQPVSNSIPHSLKLTEYLRPVFQESYMIREYCLLTSIQQANNNEPYTGTSRDQLLDDKGYSSQQPLKLLTGLYVIPSVQSTHLWFGMLYINNERSSTPSPWHGGVFRFVIKFPLNYPSSLPTIHLLPVSPSSSSSSGANPHHANLVPLQTHPDVSPSTGQFNLRQHYSSSSSASTPSSLQQQPKIYKILRQFRKSFYRKFEDVSDISSFINVGAAELLKQNYAEFLRKCKLESEESLKWFKEVDALLIGKYRGDGNLVLLGRSGTLEATPRNKDNEENGGVTRRKAVGISFL